MNITNEEQFKTICRAFFPACEFKNEDAVCIGAFCGPFIIARFNYGIFTCCYSWEIGEMKSKSYYYEKDFIAKLKRVKKDLEERGLLK